MNKKFNFGAKLDFSKIDLTPPNLVIEEILSGLPDETNQIIRGKIIPYTGPVFSYTQKGLSGIAAALGTGDKEVDIQEDLGSINGEAHKFECFLYTPEYEKYKYRLFFVRYGISHYPVSVVLEESISRSIPNGNTGYVLKCNNRGQLEDLMYSIFNSKRLIAIMQELIRIDQAKKAEKMFSETENVDCGESEEN